MSIFGIRALLPALPTVGGGNVQDVVARMKEMLEVWQGARGDGLDKVVTVRELLNANLVDVSTAFAHLAPPGATIPDVAAPEQSAVPPTPTELKATGAMTSIILEWVFPFEYTRLANFEVWRSATNALGDAVVIAEPLASVYTDEVGPNEAFYYWVRAVSDAALSPYNAVVGTLGSTAIDVGAALDALQGQISESELATALGARIDLVDGPSSLSGSVDARIATETAARIAAVTQEATDRAAAVSAEASARAAAITAEANARAAAVTAEATARGTAITNEATLRQTGDDSLALQVSLITAGVAGGFDYGKVWYFDGSVEGWTATGATLASNAGWVDATSTGTDPALLSPTALALSGSTYPVVKARIRRLAGSGWDGTCFYTTSGHGVSASFKKTIAAPTPFAVGDTAIIEFSMDALTAGGTDWVSSTIEQIRLDLGATSADVISVDWVAIGRNAPGASVAGLLTEQQARIAGDAAEATARTTLATQVTTNTAAIATEQTARANGDTANASSITALTATVNTNTADIVSEAATRASADSALSTSISSVSAVANAKNKTYRQPAAPSSGMVVGDVWFDSDDNNKAYRYDGSAWVATDDVRITANAAAIITEQTARADGDTANANSITALTATVNTNTAAITSEATARANADTALTTQINTVSAVANARNRTYRQTAAPGSGMVSGDVWFDSDDNNKAYRYDGSAWVATDDVRITANAAAIATEQTARADADTALSSQITTVSAVANAKNKTFRQSTAPVGATLGDLWYDTVNGNRVQRYDGSAWVATDDTRITANAAAIITEQTARADGDTALASQITTVSATANAKNKTYRQAAAPGSGMTTGDVWFDSDDNNKSYRYDGSAWVATDDVRITTNTAAIASEATVRATETGYLGATYTLRLDVGGVVGGYGVSGTSSGGAGATIDFGIRANKFFIMPPSGVSNVGTAAFTYLATPTAVNGVTRAAGLYVSDAFIGNGVIDTARIGNLAVDTAKIADLAVTTAKVGDLAVTTAKIVDLAVTTGKIIDLAVTQAKIANLAVGTAQIIDGNITTAKIGDLQVSTLKIQDNAVTVPVSVRNATAFTVNGNFATATWNTAAETSFSTYTEGMPVFLFGSSSVTFSSAPQSMLLRFQIEKSDGTIVTLPTEGVVMYNETQHMIPGSWTAQAGSWKVRLQIARLHGLVDQGTHKASYILALGTKK